MCWFCGERDETINRIITECSKLAQKEYKTRHNWARKVIHRELCNKLKFNHTIQLYMHKPESAMENETHKIHWNFETQTDPLVPARRPDPVIINNKEANLPNNPDRPQSENPPQNKRVISTRTMPKNLTTMEHEHDDDTTCNWCTWNGKQRTG